MCCVGNAGKPTPTLFPSQSMGGLEHAVQSQGINKTVTNTSSSAPKVRYLYAKD